MRFLVTSFLFMVLGVSALGQALDWMDNEEEALTLAQTTGKPLLFVTATSDLARQTEGALASWPRFAEALAREVVPLKTKQAAWIPLGPTPTVLALWFPPGDRDPLVWKEAPSLVELAQALGIRPPYTLPVKAFRTGQSLWQRMGEGPFWTLTTSQAPEGSTFKEEGPAGEMVILKELGGSRRVALPFHDGWSFQSEGRTQVWTPGELGKVE